MYQVRMKGSTQGATTHDIRCTKCLDFRLIPGLISLYPAVGFDQNMVVFSNFSYFFYFSFLTTVH